VRAAFADQARLRVGRNVGGNPLSHGFRDGLRWPPAAHDGPFTNIGDGWIDSPLTTSRKSPRVPRLTGKAGIIGTGGRTR
jgi:hypothetical protein